LSSAHIRPASIGSYRQVTDTYLLALAVHNAGRLASFDRRLSTVAVTGGAEALHLIA
jgi:predicted nucleic acid-binding protein